MSLQSKPSERPRIASFLPAATEMIYALGLEGHLVAVTQGCDHPAEAKGKPIVVRPAPGLLSLDPSRIDQAVRERLGRGESLYALDEGLLRRLSPDLIVTQDLCQVCAPSGKEASLWLAGLEPTPEVLYQTPCCFEEMLMAFTTLGERTGAREKAALLTAEARARVEKVRQKTSSLPKPRVFFFEWVDPIYCAGHWIAEMVGWAGGSDPLARPKEPSIRVAWEDILRSDPETLIVAPCGFNAERAAEQAGALVGKPGWKDLSAVKNGRVFAVDGDSYFARPSLRLVEGIELLAHLLHPETLPWSGPSSAWIRL